MDTNDMNEFEQESSFRANEQTSAWFPFGN